jgi:hypothetical protein
LSGDLLFANIDLSQFALSAGSRPWRDRSRQSSAFFRYTSAESVGIAARPLAHLVPNQCMLIAKQEHIMADDKLINILAWCKREREHLQMQREMLRSGTFRIFRLEGDSPVDESQKSIETLTNNIAELDLILAAYAKRSSDG